MNQETYGPDKAPMPDMATLMTSDALQRNLVEKGGMHPGAACEAAERHQRLRTHEWTELHTTMSAALQVLQDRGYLVLPPLRYAIVIETGELPPVVAEELRRRLRRRRDRLATVATSEESTAPGGYPGDADATPVPASD